MRVPAGLPRSGVADMLTVAEYLRYLQASPDFVRWPPDVFAVAVSLLQKSGAYTRAVSGWWPPIDPDSLVASSEQARRWAHRMKDIGQRWRAGVLRDPADVPDEVSDWWRRVTQVGSLDVMAIRSDDAYCEALLQICAVADEASAGVGLSPNRDDYDDRGWIALNDRGTLCEHVDPTIVRVLPKCHTPAVGMTVRSLSHHLSLVPAADVDTKWYLVERTTPQESTEPERSLNLLLVPEPRLVLSDDFRQAEGPIQNLHHGFGFFTCGLQGRVNPEHVIALFRQARSIVQVADRAQSIDAVILPELSLSEPTYEALRRSIVVDQKALLLAGVGAPATSGTFGTNYVRLAIPVEIPATGEEDVTSIEQHKHHRWLLDAAQIAQYGLNRYLDANRRWWECVDISRRQLNFVSLEPWLTLTALVCEDLARQDPVAELIRAVGPNLVIALLADGPQLAARWPARYATVLADDPGSSVLTLTSVGMVDLCRGPRRILDARPVALWKDAISGGPYELNLPADADALLLCLRVDYREEWTADGRSDASNGRGTTAYLSLLHVHPIAAPRGLRQPELPAPL